ncbi:hypothetical protein MBANPS3_008974 [Mucor bainieri]
MPFSLLAKRLSRLDCHRLLPYAHRKESKSSEKNSSWMAEKRPGQIEDCKIEAMLSELKKSVNIISEFWMKHSETLKTLALQEAVDESTVEGLLKRKVATNMAEESSSSSTAAGTAATSQPEAPTTKRLRRRNQKQRNETATVGDSELIESDKVFVTGSDISVGTTIKRSAYNLHEKKEPMSCRDDRKIMTSGLSSILDLSDDSFDSQRSLFTQLQWDELHAKYDPRFETPLVKLDVDVVDFLKIACNSLELSNDIEGTIKFLRKSQDHLSSSVSRTAIKIAEHILGLTKSYSHLLCPKSPKGVTELDYYCIVWSPIFLLLFPPSSNIRVKAGESINAVSTFNKKELYSDSSHVKGFKIDFRFLVDIKQDEYDIGVGECAIDSSDTKAVTDEGKLTREAKDSLDKVLRAVKKNVNTKIWTLQTVGSACSISMLDIFDVGLYVANYKDAFRIPSTTTHFIENIDAILKLLLTMQRDITILGNALLASGQDEPSSHQNAFNRQDQPRQLNPRLDFTRDTYYTPPKGAVSRLPQHYYGPPPPSILPRLQALSAQEDYVAQSNDDDNDNKIYDAYGYRTLDDGTFYNKFTNKIIENHPMFS